MAWRRRVSSLFACTATLLLIGQGIASAKPGYVVFPGHRTVELDLKGTNGYVIQVASRNRRHTELSASNGTSVVVYLIRRTSTRDDGIEARFPGVGHVSVEFRPAGPEQREPGFYPPCRGGEIVEQPGYFVGTIRLRGERGYTAVHTTRARGQIETARREVCKRSIFSESKQPRVDETRLYAYSRSAGRTVAFSGSTVSIPSESFTTTSFFGYMAERREEMTVFRLTTADGEGNELVLGDTRPFPSSATVAPAAPFHGSAAFQRGTGDDNSWTGSLSVELPGKGEVALAGPSFSARLCRPSGCRRRAQRSAAVAAVAGHVQLDRVDLPLTRFPPG